MTLKLLIPISLFALLVGCKSEQKKQLTSEKTDTTYYPSGRIEKLKPYRESKLNGIAKQLYEDGNLKRQTQWHDGKREGYDVKYFPNGKVMFREFYQNDTLFGSQRVFHENGKLKMYTFFIEHEEAIFRRIYDSTGKVILDEGTWEPYYIHTHGVLKVGDQVNFKAYFMDIPELKSEFYYQVGDTKPYNWIPVKLNESDKSGSFSERVSTPGVLIINIRAVVEDTISGKIADRRTRYKWQVIDK